MITFVAFLTSIRMEKATRMLKDTNMSVKEVTPLHLVHFFIDWSHFPAALVAPPPGPMTSLTGRSR